MKEKELYEEYNLERISVKSIFLYSMNIFKILWKGKYIILTASILLGILGYYLASKKPITYTATNSFMVKEEESNSIGGLMSMMGNFGFGGNKTKMNLDKVVALANSRRILKESLLDSAFIGNKSVLIANSLIYQYGVLDDLIKNKPDFINYKGIENPNNLTNQDKEVLKSLFNLVNGEKNKSKLMNIDYDKDNTIITLNVTSEREDISIVLCNSIFKKLSKFYIEQSIEKAAKTVKSLERRLGSVNVKLADQEYNLKSNQDISLGLWLETAKLPAVKLNRDAGISAVLYAEIIKNLEASRFTLINTIPIFQIIDEPEVPLTKQEPGVVKYIIGFFLMGLGLSSFLYYIFWSIKNE